MSPRAIVFAHHDVGDRCLRALVAHGWHVPLVITHKPDPNERQWFTSILDTARELAIPALAPAMPDQRGLERTLGQLRPDFVFSFYYRNMIGEALLKQARSGALNIHGSLLPRYRGRAPVNWAIVNGERETGATLHHMTASPDAGDIVDQLSVPILEDDDARLVMSRVTAAAEIVLVRNLSGLASGTAPRRPQNLREGEYCRRRTPEDGRIDWNAPARRIHDLVRAVAPPYPGAFTDIGGERYRILQTRRIHGTPDPDRTPRFCVRHGACIVVCADGEALELRSVATRSGPVDLQRLARKLSTKPLLLCEQAA